MRLTVLGACGAWPAAGDAASGYLIEHDGFRLLLDAGYATLPRLLSIVDADELDAVFVTHGHPDHCADLNPLLRARGLADRPVAPLPLYAPPDALQAVLALDRPGMIDHAYELREFTPGTDLRIGPFSAATRLLPHSRPNAGVRLTAGGRTLMYTGDSGPCRDVVDLAEGADVLLREATDLDQVSSDTEGYLCSARDAGREAAQAGAAALLLTHLWPGTDPTAAIARAAFSYDGPIDVARAGLVTDLS